MKFQYTKHRKLWNYIVENIESKLDGTEEEQLDAADMLMSLKDKFITNNYKDDVNILYSCYACHYAWLGGCGKCPLKIPKICVSDGSYFAKLLDSIKHRDVESCIYYAEKIRDLAVKDGIDWE